MTNQFDDTKKRPDIVIRNPEALGYYTPGPHSEQVTELILDTTVRSPIDGAAKAKLVHPKTLEEALKIGVAAERGYKEKMDKYSKLIYPENKQNRNLHEPVRWIVPFVIQSTGHLHEKSMEFLERLAEAAETIKRIPKVNLLTYFKRRIALCLAKNMAATMYQRGHSLASHTGGYKDRSFDTRHIMELAPEN